MKISGRAKETLAVAAVLLGVIVLQWNLWVTGKRMVSHDSIVWYGVFSYFADCLQGGVLPLWNPYMNCGEIFFLNINVLHLWDPSTLFLIFAGKLLRVNTLTVYHYDLLVRYLIFISGSYFFFRLVAKYKFSAFAAFITLSFSVLYSSYLKQHGLILCFYQLPWIVFLTFKFLEKKDPVLLLWLALFWGVTVYSGYHAVYILSSVAVLLASVFLSKGLAFPKGGGFMEKRGIAFAAIAIFLLLSANLIPAFLAYVKDTVPSVRLFEAPMAANSLPADFFTLFAPYSFALHFEQLYFNSIPMSESFLYIGLIPLFFAIVGLLYSRQRYRVGFAATLCITALLMLGPRFLVSKFLLDFIPFFNIVRNTHIFGTFFIFCLVYFTCLGVDVVLGLAENSALKRYEKRFLLIAAVIGAAAFFITRYVLENYAAPLQEFPERYKELSLIAGQDLAAMLTSIFCRSYYGALLFIVSIAVVFYVIGKPKAGLKFKYFTLISLILIDLLVFNLVMYGFTTTQRVDMSLWPKEKAPYSNYRITAIRPKYPFLGFAPALQRRFAAVSPRVPWLTTHFYEMKDFYNFANNGQIPAEVKKVFMGVTAPKIKLVKGAAVLPVDRQIEECKKLDDKSMNGVMFIEEDPPARFMNLKISPKKMGNANIGNGAIRLLEFGPNSILLQVNSEEDAFLYYSDGYDRSWRVFVDGKENKVYRANMAFKSAIIEKGGHIVYFIYDPRLYRIALLCYFAGIITAAIALILASFKRRGEVHGN
ncbi:MAG: YfhO family protein [Candidatus Omnitrophica bacterium]|nr:YfhO family protein [Candidatus Omnitrophota bacterium]MDD5310191.1 YfhO family protein [Candidatus Omnitrophota bacterium]MDD5546232.1 YfhO family protein [Candidatus Omnitrophota bacterium]